MLLDRTVKATEWFWQSQELNSLLQKATFLNALVSAPFLFFIQLEMKCKKYNKNITVCVHSVIQRLCHLMGDGE